MAPKLSKTKGDSKGKGKASTSFTIVEITLSLVSTKFVKEFEEKHQHRLGVKQYVWKPIVVGCLDIPEVVSLVADQQIDYFL